MSYIQDLFSDLYFLGLLSLALAFLLSKRMFAQIVYLIRSMNLTSAPTNRPKNIAKTPILSDAGLFAIFSLVVVLSGISAGLDQPDLAKLLSLLVTIIVFFWGLRVTLNGLIGRYHELSLKKGIVGNKSLQKTMQSSKVNKEKVTVDNDTPIISLKERVAKFTEERAAKFTEESHSHRRRKIAKEYAEEFKKITAQQ